MISINKNNQYDKTSPYECGFEFLNKTYSSFSLQFFLICVIFIVLDIEILLLIPIPLLWSNENLLIPCLIFFSILSFGYFYEWINLSLNWKLIFNLIRISSLQEERNLSLR